MRPRAVAEKGPWPRGPPRAMPARPSVPTCPQPHLDLRCPRLQVSCPCVPSQAGRGPGAGPVGAAASARAGPCLHGPGAWGNPGHPAPARGFVQAQEGQETLSETQGAQEAAVTANAHMHGMRQKSPFTRVQVCGGALEAVRMAPPEEGTSALEMPPVLSSSQCR